MHVRPHNSWFSTKMSTFVLSCTSISMSPINITDFLVLPAYIIDFTVYFTWGDHIAHFSSFTYTQCVINSVISRWLSCDVFGATLIFQCRNMEHLGENKLHLEDNLWQTLNCSRKRSYIFVEYHVVYFVSFNKWCLQMASSWILVKMSIEPIWYIISVSKYIMF